MKTETMDTESHVKRGRKPTGRVTEATNIRLEVHLKARLAQAAVDSGETQTALIEEALDKQLPPLPEDPCQ